ncbi:hypothetical protein Q4610_10205 [Sphingobium sp. HBC34]|uniref:Uncharacterized protein n=1 Tax=Sphingobium cyanobacteriorum TaxID=3063954 RepID=A0ABT8ZMR8_9SPHN|nr:DUF2087 domain-containing protein [Sphingobium sp. HBC34]MDO7835418.1 hypothetical protein [Sphingobium sp. HBC34]
MTMTGIFDRAYFAERLERNRRLAEEAANPVIRDIHLEYVRLYRHLIEEEVPV